MIEKPNFTAFMIARVMVALTRHPAWSGLVQAEDARHYAACTALSGERSPIMRLVNMLPHKIVLWLMDRLVAPGYVRHVALRKEAIGKYVSAAIAGGSRQLVVIGAGCDALGSHVARSHPDVKCFELDREGSQLLKRTLLMLHPSGMPANLHLLSYDLLQGSVNEALAKFSDFDGNAPTVYIAEGVSMYLTEEENRRWIRDIGAQCHKRLQLAITIVTAEKPGKAPASAVSRWLLRAQGEGYRFAIPSARAKEFLEECGFTLVEMRRYEQLQQAYIPADQLARLEQVKGENIYFAEKRA